MENYINYYYGIDIWDVKKFENYYVFIDKYNTYYFCGTKRLEDDISKIVDMLTPKFHSILKNKDGNYISIYDNNNYALMKINCIINDIISFDELTDSLSIIKIDKVSTSWNVLWEKKIDYLETQIRELGIGKDLLINTFSYYVGLAENAISYYNYNSVKSKNIGLCHFRINIPNNNINYWNPLGVLVDYNVRDIAEYFKSSFFNSDDYNLRDLDKLLANEKFGYEDMVLLFSRLLYPTYYFDLFEDSINDVDVGDKILNVINKQDKYEFFLKDVYYEIKKIYNIPEVKWLNKKSNKLKI